MLGGFISDLCCQELSLNLPKSKHFNRIYETVGPVKGDFWHTGACTGRAAPFRSPGKDFVIVNLKARHESFDLNASVRPKHLSDPNFSQVFAGQAVGIKEVHDDIWLVSFMDYDFGYFDLETRVLEPLQNPFGPKVLPM